LDRGAVCAALSAYLRSLEILPVKRSLISALLVAGLVVSGASAAQAADDDIVVYTDTYIDSGDDVSNYFTLVDPATLDETVLTANPYMTGDDDIWLTGIDVYGGTGYAIRGMDGEGEDILTWNIATGAQTAPVPLVYTDAGFFGEEVHFIESWALDATTDGRILAIGYFAENGDGETPGHHAVIEVDPATGVITPLVDLTSVIADEEDIYWYQGVATDPTTGITYLLGYHYDSEAANQYPAAAVAVDLSAGTIGTPVLMPAYPSNLIDDINDGDFDESGVLYLLSADGVLGTLAGPPSASSAFANLGSPAQLVNNVIAVTDAAVDDDDAALADTGSDAAVLLFGGLGALGALALGGFALAWTARRRLA
jgi:hypothetical protein